MACGTRIAFTTRLHGVSQPPFDGLNLGDHVNDDPVAVEQNRRLLLSAFDCRVPTDSVAPDANDKEIDPVIVSGDTFVTDVFYLNPVQVHGDNVVVCEGTAGMNQAWSEIREGADAVVVAGADVPVILCFADCVPVIAVAPSGDFAVIHAGWRGVVQEISAKALTALAEYSSYDVSTFNVYIGPYIHACHFEIGGEAVEKFRGLFGEDVFTDASHVDMSRALRKTFERVGVDPERVCDVDKCTVDNQDLFFSYRGAQGVCGRHGAFAVAKGC